MRNTLLLSVLLLGLVACKTTQPHRPLYHFTPPAHWMNDPNGLVYYEGEYHLFYQYYPDGTVWGPMHWGHAVSTDLLQWKHLPIALYPDSLGLIFSGSAVVDWNNTSGLGQNGKPPLVAIFTQHDMAGEKAGRTDFQYQSLAYSNDKGRTWTKYKGNPVIPNTNKIKDFRDPKVIWDEASKQWVMVFAAGDHVQLWGSADLKNWRHLSDFGREWGAHGGVWECPDLFPLKIDREGRQKWVLLVSINPGAPNGGSGTQYFVGNFDGKTFMLDTDFAKSVEKPRAQWLDWGRDNYAGVTWSDVPASDGRRLFIGWMSNWDYAQVVPTEKWRSACTLPRELTLRRTNAGLRVTSVPVRETQKMGRTSVVVFDPGPLPEIFNFSPKYDLNPQALEVELVLELPTSPATGSIDVVLSNDRNEEYRVGYDLTSRTFFSDRTKAGPNGFSDKFATKRHLAPRTETNNLMLMHLFFDRASCELFADNGSTVLTDIYFPSKDFTRIRLENTQNAPVKIQAGGIYSLQK